MKKNKLTAEKLSLNKFKIASISNFGKSKVFGGTAVNDGFDGNDDTVTKTQTSKNCASQVKDAFGKCQIGIEG